MDSFYPLDWIPSCLIGLFELKKRAASGPTEDLAALEDFAQDMRSGNRH